MFPKRCVHYNIFFFVIILSLILNITIASSQETVILKMILNKEDKGEFFLILAPDNDVWIKRDELNNIGLKEGLGNDIRFAQETYVSLRSIPGLKFQIDEKEVVLHVTAEPSLFKKQDIDISYETPYKVIFTEDRSAFLNYSLNYDYTTEDSFFDVSGELGISAGNYLGLSTFTYTDAGDTEDFVRLMTNITFNDRAKLRTVTLGDFSASSGVLGSLAVMGGINFSKNFSIDPYFLSYPSLNLSGTLESPSEIDVYLNGLLVRKERLSPGEFLFTDVPATVGLGTARIVIKDAYGRERIISTPYYYTDRLLKKGFHEYSYSIGFVREDFGEKSFSYASPAFLSFHSLGFSDNLKAGYAAEASRDLINIGPTASILVSKAGVLEFSLAFSNSLSKSGYSGFLSYSFQSFQSKNLGARISLRSHSKEYSNLTTRPSDDKAKLEFSGAVGFGTKSLGFITAEYSSSHLHIGTNTSRTGISYNRALTNRATFFITASETKDVITEDEIFLGLHVYLGKGVSGNVSYTLSEDEKRKRVYIHKSLPVGTGFGYRVNVESSDGRNDFDGILQYQNNHGIYEAGYYSRGKTEDYRLSVSGGIGYINRSIFLSRPINDSFAKVKVENLEGVRVYYYGNEVGRTDRKGSVIIPGLLSFLDNRIDIENRDIPVNYNIQSLTKYVSPPYRSGSLIKFNVSRIQGIAGIIYITEKEQEIPVESAVMLIQVKDRVVEGLVGRDGEFYLENIPPGKHPAKILYRGKECKFDIIIPDSEEMMIDLGKITCEAG